MTVGTTTDTLASGRAFAEGDEDRAVDVERVGERIRAGTRWRVKRGGLAWIAGIDMLCSGLVSEEGASAS